MRNQEHEHYSELLKPYLEGSLDADRSEHIRQHVSGCSECRAELRTLELLLDDPGPGLSDLERAGLHRAIEEAQTGSQGSGWRAKLVPALSAAALLAIVAIGITTIDFGGADENASTEAESGDVVQDENAPSTEQAASAPADERVLPYATSFQNLGKVSDRRLSALGSSGFPAGPGLFATTRAANLETDETEDAAQGGGEEEPDEGADAITAKGKVRLGRDDVRAAQGPALAALVSQAPDAETGEQISECALQVLDSNPYLMIPVFASTARFEGDPVLVIGFRWREEGIGSLNRYQVWAWPRASCEVSVYFASGRIR